MDDNVVAPGDRLSTEEEYTPSNNTYVEDGVIYSAATGTKVIKDGSIRVEALREIRKFERGMYVLGQVSDNMKSVVFVTIDRISAKNKEYLPLKDGKIVIRSSRPGFDRGPPRGGRFDRDRRGPPPPRESEEKPCKTGDTIIAKVIAEEGDTYVLGFGSPETGVIYAKCSICGGPLQKSERPEMLACMECRRLESRKLSMYYNKPAEIKNYFENIR